MFDIGFSELLIIAVVGLVVLGPQRLPHAARLAGLWIRRLRAQWYSVKADLERELAEDEFRRSVGEPLADLHKRLNEEAQALRARLESPVDPPAPTPTETAAAPVAPDAGAPDSVMHESDADPRA